MLIPPKQSPVDKKLADMRREAEERDAARRATRLGVSYANLTRAPISVDALKLVPEEEARTGKLVPVDLKNDELKLAALSPNSEAVQKVVARLRGEHLAVKTFLCSAASLEQAWSFYKLVSNVAKDITSKVTIEQSHFTELLKTLSNIKTIKAEFDKVIESHATTSTLLETILAGATNTRASDIHFEAEDAGTRIRFRIDGALHDVAEALPERQYESLLTRIKLLSGLKMNVHGEPQDGRFTIKLPAKEIEMRVSIIPSEFGETVVMRILDPDSIHVTLDMLGFRPDDRVIVDRNLSRPNGIILNTGPTGSGKTTTLYAFLQKMYDPEIKIITIEDPIEYRIKGIEQTQVNPEVGYTFAGGLRAVLRQDPDAVLVGEIRDQETADIAIQAALTGHLVLSTLHTNDAVGAVPRLLNLGIKPMSVGPSLSLVIAQRLVRRLCKECRRRVDLTPELRTKVDAFMSALPARIDRAPYQDLAFYEPVGCAACNDFGYKGRVGIYEFFETSDEFQELVLRPDISEIMLKDLARKQGMVTMQQDGALKCFLGLTSRSEVEGTTGPFAFLS